MTARPRTSFFLVSSFTQMSHAERLGPFQEACLKLAKTLQGDRPQTKNGIEARLEKSTSVLHGDKWFLCFRDTSIARTKVLEVVWGVNDKNPRPNMTQRAHHLDALGLVKSFLEPTPLKPAPQL